VRETAPPYVGEGEFALWHYSEDPSLETFRPHTPATNPEAAAQVWAVDTRHAPMFWFQRVPAPQRRSGLDLVSP
jgi:hypothetical protein